MAVQRHRSPVGLVSTLGCVRNQTTDSGSERAGDQWYRDGESDERPRREHVVERSGECEPQGCDDEGDDAEREYRDERETERRQARGV
jgi:hypothetical protein